MRATHESYLMTGSVKCGERMYADRGSASAPELLNA